MLSLSDLRTSTHETTSVSGTPASFRDELIACQHPTEDYGDAVHMAADYVFDASLDDYVEPETRRILRDLINAYPNSYLFVFYP
jgi:hypothetical protein